MSATPVVDRGAPDWSAIAVVTLGASAFAAAQGLTYPLISLTLHERGVSATLIGLNAAGFSAGLAVATLAVRGLTRVVPGERLILAALLGCAMALTTLWLVDGLTVWFLARFVLGLCAGTIFILSEAWLHTASTDRVRGRVSGLYGAGMCVGFSAGPLAIPILGTGHSFGFALTAVYVALVAFLTAVLTRWTHTRPQPVPSGGLVRVVKEAPTLVLMVVAFGFADIAAISGMPVYFVQTGRSKTFAALSVSAMSLPTALAQPVVGVLLDRWPRLWVAIGSGLVTTGSFLAVPFVESQTLTLVVFATMGSASFALYTCALTLLGERYRGGLLAAGTAVFSLAYAAGSASGSTMMGLVTELASPAAAPVVTGIVLLGFTLVFPTYRRQAG